MPDHTLPNRRSFAKMTCAAFGAALLPALVAAQTDPKDPAVMKPARKPPAANRGAGRDLSVELRQVEDTQSGGYTVGTQPRGGLIGLMAPQQVRVRNGARATLSLGQQIPVQWVSSAAQERDRLSIAGGAVEATRRSGGFTQSVTWLQSGQSLAVTPQWPGGKSAVAVDVAVQTASVEPPVGADLPTQQQSEVATRVSAPLGEWVTIAATGNVPQQGVYGTSNASSPRRLLQIRVTAL